MDDPTQYGRDWAEDYDELHGADPNPTVDAVSDLAGGGPVLEFGVGTGRIALPLADRGLEVVGIDASPEMLARLRAKPGSEGIEGIEGDFVEVAVDRRFTIVLLAANTLFGLPTQEVQVVCFTNAARHLTPDGAFVLDGFVPDPGRFDRGQRTQSMRAGGNEVLLESSLHDPVTQRVDSTILRLGREGARTYPVSVRYAWPTELDLMARLAGLRLAERWGGWRREPFTASSGMHVSIYRPA
ncbi:class I SAM-dependent methyltransferase [Egibacter rhizosphaerae]|uniref:Class I SAM-dependent methyltransferase n=1 Tax=Egibacter rhizosphaerae TaxID=1670831 RepID=A0A411YE17_9ACTN|nr:class I SAM-dependent methyltransferase [Egibacter rhizosphaerae]QBI19455.1 class I SAM-dependent methyltransferase [Egibacter rhizosphaerae]